MSGTAGRAAAVLQGARAGPAPAAAEGRESGPGTARLLGIGAAAERAGVSQRALRYYQQIGLLTPCSCTPGGLRRYSEDDVARVARIRQLQELLGLDLDAIARVLHDEDRMAQIKRAYVDERTGPGQRQALLRESLDLQHRLRGIVEAKLKGIEGVLADIDARIGRTHALLDQFPEPAGARAPRGSKRES